MYRQINALQAVYTQSQRFDSFSTVRSLFGSRRTSDAHFLDYRKQRQRASSAIHVAESYLSNLQATASVSYNIVFADSGILGKRGVLFAKITTL